MEKLKKWHIAFLVIMLFIIAPVALYWLVCTPNPWGWGFIKPEDTGAWLGFYGAVLGGAITLVGVVITLNKQEKTRLQEVKPILLLSDSDRKVYEDYHCTLTLVLNLKNLGGYEAYDVEMKIKPLNSIAKSIDYNCSRRNIIVKNGCISEYITIVYEGKLSDGLISLGVELKYTGLNNQKFISTLDLNITTMFHMPYIYDALSESDGYCVSINNFKYIDMSN